MVLLVCAQPDSYQQYKDSFFIVFRIYWINPLAYGYKALLINEMKDQVYSCEGPGNAVPYGPGYDDWNHKVSEISHWSIKVSILTCI